MTLRWGIVSAGKISHDFVNAFNSYPENVDQAIVGIAARDSRRAAEFANIHGIPNVFDSYQSMAISKDIDVVYIGALNPDHYDLAKIYLENGKHVLCEKPLCLNYKQAKSLIDFAEKKKLFLMEAVWSRFSPAYQALEEEIKSGKLGEVQFVEANFGVQIASVDRLRLKSMGGGAILDLGIYVLQFSQYIFKDEPIKVTAVGEVNEDGVDMVETVILQYSGGRYAVLNVNSKLRLLNNATVVGTKGRIVVKEPFHFPTELEKSDGSMEKFPLHQSPISSNFENSAGLVYEALEVAICIRAGLLESPRMTHKESLLLAKLEDEVRRQLGVHHEADDKEYS